MSAIQQAFLFVAILVSISLLGALFYQLTPVLVPFLIAAAVAYLFDPIVERLTRPRWKISRTLAVSSVFVLLTLIAVIVLFFLIPTLQRQLTAIMMKIPLVVEWLQNELLPKITSFFGLAPEDLGLDALKNMALSHMSETTQLAKWLWQTLFHSGLAMFGWFMNALIILVVTFYLLRDWPVLLTKGATMLPTKMAPRLLRLFNRCDEILSTFVRGQLSVMVALGTFYGLFLTIMGVNFSLLLGMLAGLLSIVPYLGSAVGLGAALIVTYFQFHEWLPIVGVLTLFSVGHLVEGMFLTPWLIGDKLGLHPVVVIFAVLAGGQLLGIVGVILALPVAAILVAIAQEFSQPPPAISARQGVISG